MDEDSIGFSAKAPISAWYKRIDVDGSVLFRAALKSALAYFTSNAAGAIGSAIDATAAFKLRQLPPAELAWLLIQRALARAMAELTVEAVQKHGAELGDKDGLVATLDNALDATEIWIDPAFFERPADSAIVGAVQAPFTEWLVALGLNQAEAASVLPRFGAYFTFALRREWARDADVYAPIDAEIAKYENRFVGAEARERAWLRNAAYLERQIHEPVFEESFGLSQIYVPLRAWHLESPASKKGRGRDREETRERRHVVDLERYLDAWFASANRKDTIRVICGGPGSGKTSSAKIWAAKLAAAGHRVLFVPLHRLELRDERPDVQAALWEFLRDLDVVPVDPLDASDGEPRLLVLFDGLDELAMQGRAGQEAARSFVEAVERKLDLLNGRSDRFVQVVFGGRDLAVQSARLPDHQVINVMPYHDAGSWFEDPENLLQDEDYACDRWWQRFGQAVGEQYRSVPKPLRDKDLAEITAQPLLNYLLALSYRRGELDFSDTPNLNLIYRDLLDAVYERRWGPGRHPTQKQLKREEFDDLLDELGLAAWHGAGRTVTEAEVVRACERAGLQEQLAAFQEGARAGAISLLAAFYFRQAGKVDGERTFEFTHKSFGEYLTSRGIVRWMDDIHEERSRNRKNRQRGWTEGEALVKWIELTGPAALHLDSLPFLKREIALKDRDILDSWRICFAELFDGQLDNRLPMQRLELPTYEEMTFQARNAEEALLAAHFCCASAISKCSFVRSGEFWFNRLVSRLRISSDVTVVAPRCLGWLEIPDYAFAEYRNADRTAYFGTVLLSCLNLEGVTLRNGSLQGAKMFGAILRRADLRGMDLKRAELHSVNLEDADLRGTDLEGADLRDANVSGANFREVNLEGADLVGVSGLEKTIGFSKVRSWKGATVERQWVERLGLDAKKLGLVVVEDVEWEPSDWSKPDKPRVVITSQLD